MAEDTWWPIKLDSDIVATRQHGRQLAGQLGFSSSDQVLIATAISEIARNIVQYAGRGQVSCRVVTQGRRRRVPATAANRFTTFHSAKTSARPRSKLPMRCRSVGSGMTNRTLLAMQSATPASTAVHMAL